MSGRVWRFGLVGCGRIAVSADERFAQWANAAEWLPLGHLSAMTATPELAVVAVCDRDPGAVADARHRYDIDHGYDDLGAMLEREHLDGLAIATPPAVRRAVVELAVEHGIRGLYCEKPLATTLEDADAIAELVARHEVALVYGTRRRFMGRFLAARRQIAAGLIGDLESVVVGFPASALVREHPHSVDLLQFMSGDAAPLSVQGDLDAKPSNALDADPVLVAATVRFDTGCVGSIVRGQGFDVHAHGTHGILHVSGDGSRLTHRRPRVGTHDYGLHLDETELPVGPVASGTVAGYRALCAAMGGEAPAYRAADARRNMEILVGVVESWRDGGRRVQWPIPRRGLRLTERGASPPGGGA